jgi:hypothetical protein
VNFRCSGADGFSPEHPLFGEVSTVQPAIAAVLILASDRLKAGFRTW